MFLYVCSAFIAASVQVVCRILRPGSAPSTSARALPSTIQDSTDPSELYAEAVKLEKAADAASAAVIYERVLELDPTHKDALYNLATLYMDGHSDGDNASSNLERNPARAVTLSRKSIDTYGDVRAMHNLGLLLRYGPAPVTKNTKAAKDLWERALEKDPQARTMFVYAVLLEDEKDSLRAKKLYEEAIAKDNNYVNAIYNLAVLLRNGAEDQGVPKDNKRSLELYERAVTEFEEVPAIYNYSSILWYDDDVKDQPRAVKLLSRAADGKGDVDSMVLLGQFLVSGGKGVKKDLKRATKLFDRAIAEGRNVEAMYQRALIARNVEKNNEMAVQLLKRAMDEGQHVNATELLGEMVLLGEDQPSRESRASKLFEVAAKEGHHVAMYNLARLLESGADGVTPDLARAKELYEKAATEDDHSCAMNRLGVMYRDGVEGLVTKDAKKAVEWFTMAVRDDANVDAMVNLADMLLEGGPGVSTNVPTALALLEHAIGQLGFIPAMSKLALHLWTGDDGVTKDVPRAMQLTQKAVDAEHRIFDIMLLSRMYMSPMAGDLQDVDRGQALLDDAFRRRAAEPIIARFD